MQASKESEVWTLLLRMPNQSSQGLLGSTLARWISLAWVPRKCTISILFSIRVKNVWVLTAPNACPVNAM